jgi:hypothetical protein
MAICDVSASCSKREVTVGPITLACCAPASGDRRARYGHLNVPTGKRLADGAKTDNFSAHEILQIAV